MSNNSEHILEQLKSHLNSISEEDLKKEWESIPELDGPTIDEYLKSITQSKPKIK